MHVDLADGSSLSLSPRAVESEGLVENQPLSDSRLTHLKCLEEAFAARRKALDLLALREQSKARLALKLRLRGFSDDAVGAALDDLESSGAVDDLRFAELWISARTRRNPSGRIRLNAGLLDQGVSRSVAAEALRAWTDEDEQTALRRAVDKIMSRSGMTLGRALRSLVGKGFSIAASRRALDLPEIDR